MASEQHVTFQSVVDSYELEAILGRISPLDAAFLRNVFERWNQSAVAVEQRLVAVEQMAARGYGLLEEVGGWKLTVSVHDVERYNDLIVRTRAYLAEYKEPA